MSENDEECVNNQVNQALDVTQAAFIVTLDIWQSGNLFPLFSAVLSCFSVADFS